MPPIEIRSSSTRALDSVFIPIVAGNLLTSIMVRWHNVADGQLQVSMLL